jgi:hypothetical protein
MAKTPEFLDATDRGIKDKRMTDRECVLRYAAFKRTHYSNYVAGDIDGFLSDAMAQLNRISSDDQVALTDSFLRTMRWARRIFDRSAFRKQAANGKRYPINKALFEAWSVNIDRLVDNDLAILERRTKTLQNKFIKLAEDVDFLKAVSQGTGDPAKVRLRFGEIEKIIQEVVS